MIYKTCSKCNISYPCNSDYFHKSKEHKYGYKNICKSCVSTYMKLYKIHNTKPSEYKYQYINKYRETLKGSISHKISTTKRSYRFQNRYGNIENRLTLTTNEFLDIYLNVFDMKCAYCGEYIPKPTISMVKRFSHGGDLEYNNVVCSCYECAKNKIYKTSHEDFRTWYKKYKYFSQDRYETILNHITKG